MTNMYNKPCWSIVYSVYINKFVYSVSFSDVFFYFYNCGKNSCEWVRRRAWVGLNHSVGHQRNVLLSVQGLPSPISLCSLIMSPCRLIVGRATDWTDVTVDASWQRKRERQYTVIQFCQSASQSNTHSLIRQNYNNRYSYR